MISTPPTGGSDLDQVLACRFCGYPFVLFLKNGRTREQDPPLKSKRVSCPDCNRVYLRAKNGDQYHLEGESTAWLDTLEASEWCDLWRRSPRILLDTFDEWGRHVWLRVSLSLIEVLERRPNDAFLILASQRPGSFDPKHVRFICWHFDDYGPEGYRIAELLLSE